MRMLSHASKSCKMQPGARMRKHGAWACKPVACKHGAHMQLHGRHSAFGHSSGRGAAAVAGAQWSWCVCARVVSHVPSVQRDWCATCHVLVFVHVCTPCALVSSCHVQRPMCLVSVCHVRCARVMCMARQATCARLGAKCCVCVCPGHVCPRVPRVHVLRVANR